jgi:hypothetical protein
MPLVINTPSLTDQTQQGIWGGAQAGVEPMAGDLTLALAGRGAGDHLHDPGAARPVGLDVLWCLFGLGFPPGLTPVARLDIRCCEQDLALSIDPGSRSAGTESFDWISRSTGGRPPAPGTSEKRLCRVQCVGLDQEGQKRMSLDTGFSRFCLGHASK